MLLWKLLTSVLEVNAGLKGRNEYSARPQRGLYRKNIPVTSSQMWSRILKKRKDVQVKKTLTQPIGIADRLFALFIPAMYAYNLILKFAANLFLLLACAKRRRYPGNPNQLQVCRNSNGLNHVSNTWRAQSLPTVRGRMQKGDNEYTESICRPRYHTGV